MVRPYRKLIIYLYSCQLLIWMSSSFMEQKASMKALARRALVISGMLWSMRGAYTFHRPKPP